MSLEIKNLTKSFGKKILFKNFSFSFSDKGVYALMGESGHGKTTLLRLICGLDADFEGEIVGGGIKNSAIAFQEYRLFPNLSATDNLIFANHDKKSEKNIFEAKSLLLQLGFSEEDTELFPDSLSGGMKERVSLARAFLRPAKILLLDEPTKELDEENAMAVLEKIKEEAKKRLVIIVTHNENHARLIGATIVNI